MSAGLEVGGATRPELPRVVVIGAESTGKTELAEWLAATLGVSWSAEYAREYAAAAGGAGALSAADVEAIARGQLALEDRAITRAMERGDPLVLHDTDLVSTETYAAVYYGDSAVPEWLRASAVERRGDLYLFCDTDLPFAADAVRDALVDRAVVQQAFADALRRHRVRHVPVTGDRGARRARALAAIRGLLPR